MNAHRQVWPKGRAFDGGLDEIPLPSPLPGRLWLCGKHAIAPDPERLLTSVSAADVVCLTERSELVDRYPDYVDWLDREVPTRAVWFPIHDLGAPPLEPYLGLLDDVFGRLVSGRGIIAHCAAGIGRAGTLAVAVLMVAGVDRAVAERHVAAHRPMAGPEAGPQAELLEHLAGHLAGRPAGRPTGETADEARGSG